MMDKKNNYLFGPVQSRRLGRSLGIDLVPAKTCSFDCVYCEAGRTTMLTLDRQVYVPTPDVIVSLETALKKDPLLESATFSGAGEPTLHAEIGQVISSIRHIRPDLQVAVLTNGTLMTDPDVHSSLRNADLVKISVDAISKDALNRINRPHPDLDWGAALEGIREFAARFEGTTAIEVFLVPGINDSESEMAALQQFISTLSSVTVQINTLDRPGTESWVSRPPKEQVEAFTRMIGNSAETIDCGFSDRRLPDVAGRPPDITSALPDRQQILAMIRRRPCTVADLSRLTGVSRVRIERLLEELIKTSEVWSDQQARGTFYFTR